MKKIILLYSVAVFLFFSGCSDEELIEIVEENQATDIETEAGNQIAESRPLVVYVCGEVNKPGVYELSEGARIIDAVMAADGYTNNACCDYINLASIVNDGDRVYIPSFEEIEASTGTAGATVDITVNSSDGLVNINTATKEELMTLPGIGESKAEKIITYREENGGFKTPEDIMNISGIKEGMYNKIKDRICVR